MTSRSAVKVVGLQELLRDLNALPPETQRWVRRGSFQIADTVARDVRGWLGTAQAAPLLSKVRAKNDRVPTIRMGGDGRSGVSGGATLGQLLGANFGTRGGHKQFPPRKQPDYYVFALIKQRSSWITRTWIDYLNRALASIDPAVRRGA